MYPWDEARRQQAAIQEQDRINEEIAERDRAELRNGRGGLGFMMFIIVVIFFKPIAEYFIELYTAVGSFFSSIGGVIGL